MAHVGLVGQYEDPEEPDGLLQAIGIAAVCLSLALNILVALSLHKKAARGPTIINYYN